MGTVGSYEIQHFGGYTGKTEILHLAIVARKIILLEYYHIN